MSFPKLTTETCLNCFGFVMSSIPTWPAMNVAKMRRRPLRGIASSPGMPPRTGVSTCGVTVVGVERLHVAAVGRIDRVEQPREHVDRDGAPAVVAGDEPHVHRPGVVGEEDRSA